MTDTTTNAPNALPDADGWIVHDGIKPIIAGHTPVDLRFFGSDSVRTPPYVRHHEMHDQEADTVRWTWLEQPHGRHRNDVSHWRLASWKEGRDERGHLRADAHVTFRLVMTGDGRAPAATMIAAWNMLNQSTELDKRTIADLPADMTRIGNQIVCDVPLVPLVLTFREAVTEALRLSGEHRQPDEKGWHRMSNVARVLRILVRTQDMREIGATHSKVADALRGDALLETRNDGGNVLMRPRDPSAAIASTRTLVTCPGEDEPRELYEQPSFGAAFRALAADSGDMIANGTTVLFKRGEETRSATWSQSRKRWMTPEGQPLLRSDPSDPVEHDYRNGHMVGTKVGFVSTSRTGIHFANVGIPRDSEGDEDAFVAVHDSHRATDLAEAEALLAARDDLDHVLSGVTSYDGQMGFWLKGMG